MIRINTDRLFTRVLATALAGASLLAASGTAAPAGAATRHSQSTAISSHPAEKGAGPIGWYGLGWFERAAPQPTHYAKNLSLNATAPSGGQVSFDETTDVREARAVINSAPGVGERGQISQTNSGAGQEAHPMCLTDWQSREGNNADGDFMDDSVRSMPCRADLAPYQQWRMTADGVAESLAAPGRYLDFWNKTANARDWILVMSTREKLVFVGQRYPWDGPVASQEVFTAEASFDTDVTELATISGEATLAGSSVRVLNGTAQIGQDITPVSGRWSLALPASIGMGSHTLVIQRIVGGAVVESLTKVVDYGKPVTVDVGTTGTGTVGLAGDGSAGASLTLTVEGRDYHPVVNGGRWTQSVQISRPEEQVASITQHARGNVITRAEGAINAGASGTPFELTNPKDGGTVTQVRGKVAFHGKALEKTTVELWDRDQTEPEKKIIGDGTAIAGNTWTVSDVTLSVGVHHLRAKYIEPGAGPQNLNFDVTVKASAGTEHEFELLTPGADGLLESFVNKDGVNCATFSGLGTTGAHVEIWTSGNSAPDRLVAKGDVDIDGNWEGSGGISNWTWRLQARYTLDGTTTTHDFTAIVHSPRP